jgi:pilus assembly protein CpaC
MKLHSMNSGTRAALAAATALAASMASVAVPSSSATAQVVTQRANTELAMSVGRGQIINLPVAISDVVISNDEVVDVQVRSPRQIYVFAKTSGESSVFATTRDGRVVFSANVRVGQNVNSLDDMLRMAMPEAQIKATSMNGLVLLTGTVATPEDAEEAERLTKAFLGKDVEVVSRLRTATPLTVNLQVRIAEVNRDFMKKVGVNLVSQDRSSGFKFGIRQGRDVGTIGTATDPVTGAVKPTFNLSNAANGAIGAALSGGGSLLGLDLLGALDLAESNGLSTTLAQPTLTALSGETASFLAGGEIPIPISQGQGQISVEYKQYGVSLAFTPTVLSNGRIAMRVRPEVSQLNYASAVTLNGFAVPGLTTRRTETTVELGSGQSFMIGGLLMNTQSNVIEKVPGIGDLAILGALFRSNQFRRSESELVIVVTPYLVNPVSAGEIALPTDGIKTGSDAEHIIMGQQQGYGSVGPRPVPTMGAPVTIPADGSAPQAQQPSQDQPKRRRKADAINDPAPGFGN